MFGNEIPVVDTSGEYRYLMKMKDEACGLRRFLILVPVRRWDSYEKVGPFADTNQYRILPLITWKIGLSKYHMVWDL